MLLPKNNFFHASHTFCQIALIAISSCLTIQSTDAHEGIGRAGLKESPRVDVESEFYAGERGYLHGGLGAIMPLNDDQKIGIVGHFVREESAAEIFPSLGAEFIQNLGDGYEIEGFTFGYLPVEDQSAWALGLRGRKTFATDDHCSLSPFFGPTYARVRAIDESTDDPLSIGHFMLLGGISVEAGPLEFTVFASYSFFSRDPVGLETHVDLEEMTHLAAYENNDGFARNTTGIEASYQVTEWLTLASRYAFIHYEDRTRHSIAFTPEVKIGSQWEVFAGVQLLRGDGEDNDLLVTGAAYSF